MNETLEELINNTVSARLKVILDNAMESSNYKSVQDHIEKEISRITLEEFKDREPEIRAIIATKIASMDVSAMECNVYTKIKGPHQQ